MSVLHVLCTVDHFRSGPWPYASGDGETFTDETRIYGWFLSHGEVLSMEVTFDGPEAPTYAVESFHEPSQGVWHVHGATFGDRARNCRFAGVFPMPPRGSAFGRARLRVRMSDGSVVHELPAPRIDVPPAQFGEAEAALAAEFESIGDNCEFGLLQRRVGRERMGLLRYAGVLEPLALAEALRCRFEGFAEDDLSMATLHEEWVCNTSRPRLDLHTGRAAASIGRDEIIAQERLKLQFLAGKLIEDIEAGQKMLVYRTLRGPRGGPDGTLGMNEIYDAIAAIGPSALLWVNEADDQHDAGTVVHVRDRLFRGFIRRLTPYGDAHAADDAAWLDLLAKAKASRDESR